MLLRLLPLVAALFCTININGFDEYNWYMKNYTYLMCATWWVQTYASIHATFTTIQVQTYPSPTKHPVCLRLSVCVFCGDNTWHRIHLLHTPLRAQCRAVHHKRVPCSGEPRVLLIPRDWHVVPVRKQLPSFPRPLYSLLLIAGLFHLCEMRNHAAFVLISFSIMPFRFILVTNGSIIREMQVRTTNEISPNTWPGRDYYQKNKW